jgi:actin-like ATPase involved in cell morphogenesis
MSGHSPYLGIDFGTTNSSMAWFNPKTNQAEIILSEEGEQKIPSLVYYGEGGVIVGSQVESILDDLKDSDGEERRNEMLRIVPSIKRNLITPPSIPIPGNRDVRPVEVVAEILRKLKRDAEKGHFNEEVRRAVITYPAVFDATQRKKIVEAAKLAGFHEVEMAAEPVAAAIAFAKAHQNISKGVLVYDLGGGTFDLALVVRDEDDSFRVAMETDGDPACGGDDFDQALYDYWDKQAQKELGRPISPTTGAIDQPFLKQCRRRKENLSVREQASFSSFLPGSHKRFEPKIDRTTFHGLIRDRVEKTVRKTAAMMKQAKDKGLKVESVVLIGGSSRLPLVQDMLKSALQIEPRTWMHKDVAVALGAAYYAQQIWTANRNGRSASPPKVQKPPPNVIQQQYKKAQGQREVIYPKVEAKRTAAPSDKKSAPSPVSKESGKQSFAKDKAGAATVERIYTQQTPEMEAAVEESKRLDARALELERMIREAATLGRADLLAEYKLLLTETRGDLIGSTLRFLDLNQQRLESQMKDLRAKIISARKLGRRDIAEAYERVSKEVQEDWQKNQARLEQMAKSKIQLEQAVGNGMLSNTAKKSSGQSSLNHQGGAGFSLTKKQEEKIVVQDKEGSILELLWKYKKKLGRLYVFPEIPSPKLRNAILSCALPLGTRVLGLIDLTTFGSAKDCALFTLDGMYVRYWNIHNSQAIYQPYKDLVNLRIIVDRGALKTNNGMNLLFGLSQPEMTVVCSMVEELVPIATK